MTAALKRHVRDLVRDLARDLARDSALSPRAT
jgi:hypothetical protein